MNIEGKIESAAKRLVNTPYKLYMSTKTMDKWMENYCTKDQHEKPKITRFLSASGMLIVVIDDTMKLDKIKVTGKRLVDYGADEGYLTPRCHLEELWSQPAE